MGGGEEEAGEEGVAGEGHTPLKKIINLFARAVISNFAHLIYSVLYT